MTRKRRYLISAAVLVACVCIAIGVAVMLPQPGITKRNFDRIEKGMTMAEVKAMLGAPREADPKGAYWRHRDGTHVFVVLNDDGKVESAEFLPSNETIYNTFRRWTGTSEE